VGIPDLLIFIVCGPILGVIEYGYSIICSRIIMSKIISHGVEGTMMAVFSTVYIIS
jgi:hypothetical protein